MIMMLFRLFILAFATCLYIEKVRLHLYQCEYEMSCYHYRKITMSIYLVGSQWSYFTYLCSEAWIEAINGSKNNNNS
jgi:hypothetical protein